jgi:cation:H+ antiporter
MDYLYIIAGLVLLLFAGDFLVRGAVSLAQRFGVPTLIIGLTIIAFGTSAPELVVGIDAVLTGAPTLALGNVVGSNIANVLLVIGVPAFIAPMACNAPKMGRNMIIMIGASIIFFIMASFGTITAVNGLILLALLICFLLFSALQGKKSKDDAALIEEYEELAEEPVSYGKASFLIIAGLLGLSFGADLLVAGSVNVARSLGVSEAVIGLTLVAIGTSLPELVTAIVAAVRGHCDVAVGNVIGSNIFNTLGIIGVASLFGDIPVPDSFVRFDLWVMLGASLLLIPYYKTRKHVGKISGLIMILLYGAYLYNLTLSAESASAMGLPI